MKNIKRFMALYVILMNGVIGLMVPHNVWYLSAFLLLCAVSGGFMGLILAKDESR